MTYPTSANCKTYIGASGAGDDTLIGWLLDGVIAWVEAWCGHDFVAQAAQTVKVMPEYPNILGRSRKKLLIRDFDLMAVTSVTNGDGVSVASGDYTLLPLSGPPYFMIELTPGSGKYWWRGWDGEGVVTIVGTTGQSTACPADVFQAILMLVAHFYRGRSSGAGGPLTTATRQGMVIEADKVPKTVLDLLANHRRVRA